MKKDIDFFQSLYREYLALQAQDEALFANLKRRQELISQLKQFYFDGKWCEYYEAIENGADIDLTTDGEYSVMGQDTLWDMFCDERAFYECLVKFAQSRLDELTHR